MCLSFRSWKSSDPGEVHKDTKKIWRIVCWWHHMFFKVEDINFFTVQYITKLWRRWWGKACVGAVSAGSACSYITITLHQCPPPLHPPHSMNKFSVSLASATGGSQECHAMPWPWCCAVLHQSSDFFVAWVSCFLGKYCTSCTFSIHPIFTCIVKCIFQLFSKIYRKQQRNV